ncbi:LysR family transcriptional regulator [Pantoea dispersa]|uniref:LysR family transcriptional regulator n=1 Tax=Pantoea dispersa TaxID=59814 RepID=UPI0007364D02|nr:LysR family transcriptional regulator [Pantoea dispersa]KTR98859.1 LysR family transcriptional regulator [Pantoea dispersa]QZY92684.1 LysR family transcriptional regulator [Pantoea dispersa]
MAFDERMLKGMGVLTAVVKGGSFATAAEALDMSPSGVSRAIVRLENRLGIRLFERTTRSIALTDEGQRFYTQIVPLLAGLEEATACAIDGRNSVRGRLRVNVHPFFSRLILGPRLGQFLKQHPDLQVELSTREELGDLVAEGFDLAIRFGEHRSSTLVARKLLDTRILTVASPAYITEHGKPMSPDELSSPRHTCIQFRSPETGKLFTWEFQRGNEIKSLNLQGQLIVNNVGTLHGTCLAGYGIAQIMELGAEQLLAEGKLVDLFPEWPDERFPLYALYPSRTYLPAKISAFLNFVSAIVTEPVIRT